MKHSRSCFDRPAGPRVLNQNRGNGGQGVWKVEQIGSLSAGAPAVRVLHAGCGSVPEKLALAEFMALCEVYFTPDGCIVDQPFQLGLPDDMIRCCDCACTDLGSDAGGLQFDLRICQPQPEAGRLDRWTGARRDFFWRGHQGDRLRQSEGRRRQGLQRLLAALHCALHAQHCCSCRQAGQRRRLRFHRNRLRTTRCQGGSEAIPQCRRPDQAQNAETGLPHGRGRSRCSCLYELPPAALGQAALLT